MPKKILFICHDGGRTGAPLLLLQLVSWIRLNTSFAFEILLLKDGPLRHDFQALAPVHLFPADNNKRGFLSRFSRKLGYRPSRAKRQIISMLVSRNFDLIYANTIVTGHTLEALAPLKCPAITHVHELDYWIEQGGPENLQKIKLYSQSFIAASRAVESNLVNKYGIPAKLIDVVHSFINVSNIDANRPSIRTSLGVPAEAFLVIGSGYETWRKGKDLFVQLAAQLGPEVAGNPVHFLWVGGWESDVECHRIKHDVRLLGLQQRVHLIGGVTNPIDYFAASDVFVMVSREDPFPLVCLEAAAVGKPVLCFADAGGMPEFVEDDAGFVVPYLDINAMAEKLIILAKDSELKEALGAAACRKVTDNYDISKKAREIMHLINKTN